MTPLVVIQARAGSTRFPRKVFMNVGTGRSMLNTVARRVAATGWPSVLANPGRYPELDESDVLTRVARVVQEGPPYDPIIRVTADCPLWDSGVAHWVVRQWVAHGQKGYLGTGPEWDGLDVEVFDRRLLGEAHRAAQGIEREHMTTWMMRQPDAYRLRAPFQLDWSVDTPDDLAWVRRVMRACQHCWDNIPWHSNAAGSISGEDRLPRFDLHHLPAGDLCECAAYDILKERAHGQI